MLRVVIADDEERVCRLVQMLADWDALNMEVAGTAANGIEALELVEKLEPHILITDIRMPGCDGLELIKRAKGICPDLQIIVISGYAQFEYAQTAIRFGVAEYLLKPIKKEALMSTLERLGDECREHTSSVDAMESLRTQSHSMLMDKFIDDLLQEKFCADTWSRLCSVDEQEDSVYQAFIFKVDYDSNKADAPTISMMEKKVEEVVETALQPLGLFTLFKFRRSLGYGVLYYKREKTDQMRGAQRDALNQMKVRRSIYGNVDFSLAIGGTVDSARQLTLSLQQARMALAERLVEGTARLLETSQSGSGIRIQQVVDKYNRMMDYAVDALSIEEADKALDELIAAVKQTDGVLGSDLFELVITAGRAFDLRINSGRKSELLTGFEQQCELCISAQNLYDCIRAFQTEQIELLLRNHESETIRPIRLAKQYVQQNFSRQITLEDVCADIGFSVSYFSTIFKKETGEGFSKYLTRVRIEQAKLLLQETTASVADICEQVGYSDLKHFTGTFKKATSLNPGQYRKLYG